MDNSMGDRRLYERTPALLWVLHPDGTLAIVSDYWLQTLDYGRAAVVGQPATAFVMEPGQTTLIQTLQDLWLFPGEETSLVCNLITGTGVAYPVTLTATGVRDDQNQPQAITVAMVPLATPEVVSRDPKVDKLSAPTSPELLQTIFDTLPQRVFWKDRQGRFLGCNRQFVIDMGFSDPAEVVGKTNQELGLSSDQSAYYQAADTAALANGRATLQQERLKTYPNGTRRWVRSSKVPLRQEDGTLIGVVDTYEDITAQKETVQALQRYVQMVEASTDGICLIDRQYRYQVANQTYIDWYGQDGQPVLGHTVAEVLGQDAFETRLKPLLDQALQGEIVRYAQWFDFPNQDRRFRSVTCIPYWEPDGSISGFVTSIRDLTDLKQVEARQQELEELIEATSDFIGMATTTGQVTYVNPAMAHFLGWDNESCQNLLPCSRQIREFYPPWVIKLLRQTALPTAIAKGTWQGETAFLSPTGEAVPVSQTITAHRGADGTVKTFSTIMRDIRDRKTLEDTLRHQQHYFQTLTEQTSEIVVILRDRSTIHYVSPAVETALGYAPRDLVGQDALAFIHPEDRELAINRLRLLMAQPHTPLSTITYRMGHRDGSWRVFEVNSTNLLHDPVVQGIVTHCRDISDRVRAEQALRHVVEGTAAVTGADFFPALAQHLATALEVAYVLISEISDTEQLTTLAVWSAKHRHRPPFTYSVENTPCQRTLEQGTYTCVQKVTEQFPQDQDLQAMEAESYLGVALISQEGETLGEICVLDTRPIQDPDRIQDILRIFAARATAELERQKSNIALRDSQARFHRLADNMPGVIYRYHTYPDGRDRFSYLSASCQTIWELSAAAICQDSRVLWDQVHPDDLEVMQESITTALATNTLWSQEHRIITPSGILKWCQGIAKAEQQPDGSWIWDGILIDITERKQAEAALRASEALNRAMIKAIPDLLIRLHRDGICLDMHHPPNFPVAFPREMQVGRYIQDCNPPEVAAPRLEAARRALATGQIQVYEFQIPINDRLQWEESRTVPIGQDEVLVVVRNIDERKRAEEEISRLNHELALQNQHLEQLVEQRTVELITFMNALPDQIFVVDRESGLMPFANEATARAAGRLRSQFEHQPIEAIFGSAQSTYYRQQNRWVFETGTTLHVEESMATPQGLVYVDTYKIPLKRPNGEVYALIGTSRDITALVEAKQALTLQTAQLEATNRELKSFSYSISHDLRAPLRHINGFIAALQQQFTALAIDDDKINHYMTVIQRSSKRMEALIEGLLTLSRVGRREFAPQPLALTPVAEAALSILGLTPNTPGNPRVQLDPLPTVNGDSVLLQQVFTNLLENALKFSCDANPTQVHIGYRPQEKAIFVKDNGIGFDMAYGDKLFSPFQRLHTNAQYAGTGIGLAIVQRIIHRHGGRIWAESTPNHGATLLFTLEPEPDSSAQITTVPTH